LNKKSRTRLLVATGVIVAVFIIGVVFLVQKQGAYYRQVSDLTTGQYDGKNVKVGGRVLDGTVKRDASGVLFTIEDLTGKPDTVKVLYSGQMPNTFDAGVDVVVIGKYASNGALITADQLQTKCPSKYKGSASPAAQSIGQ
jgi:cytochrome c-type biogenesis protein CcmE